MVMYSITSKLNSTFRMIGMATADKMTAKVVSKLKLPKNQFEHAVMQQSEILHITELPVPFLSCGFLYLGVLGYNLNSIFAR